MLRLMVHLRVAVLVAILLGQTTASSAHAASVLGAADHPLRVILIPADGGTEDGTKADYQPLFNAVSRMTGLNFTIRVGQSYAAVVEALCSGSADIAFVGAVSYIQAHDRGCAELLAVAVEKGQSTYYAGLFARSASSIRTIKDVRGKRVAFGDVNSTASFVFPISMLMEAGIDPVRDLSEIRLTGSHANSLAALTQGQVDVAALSFDSFDKALRQGAVSGASVRVIAKSAPIPYPPLVMNSKIPATTKARLKSAFATVHTAPGVTPAMVRGYGGAMVDRYDTQFSPAKFNVAAVKMARLNDQLKGEILKKAAHR
jgi:phosphonate transport system substrate-binding protein